MAQIVRLQSSLIDKIAAGEVVERPASVVKELVENSVDAGATQITVEVENGGTTLIRVSDNGSGIERQFVKEAFLRHATSKIASLKDLENVLTLGFRGEALSSISSVSQVELITKTPEDHAGIRLELEGGTVLSERETGCSDGTSFTVRNLFYNTPARRKFMKKPASESGYISDIMGKLILGHPEIAFKYVNNGSVMMQSNGDGDKKTALFAVYGKDAAMKTLQLKSVKGEYELTGLIGKPELSRANRSYGQFFINGRFIKSDIVSKAVEEAYKTRLLVGKFPVYVLYMKTDPSNIDINVHPTKLEVRFEDEDFIFDFVREAVDKTFEGENLIPSVKLDEKKPVFSEVNETAPYSGEAKSFRAAELGEPEATYTAEPEQDSFKLINAEPLTVLERGVRHEQKEQLAEEKPRIWGIEGQKPAPQTYTEIFEKGGGTSPLSPGGNDFFKDFKICGQVFGTYWIVEQGDCLYVVDQHAAHEKVLYEEFTAKYKAEQTVSQKLAFPVAVNLSEREMIAVNENGELLRSLGFETESFGSGSIAVRAVPYIMGEAAGTSCFVDIVDGLLSPGTKAKSIYDSKADEIASKACKAAVKANDRLNYAEAKALISRLLTLENPFTCPHGRPTIIEITKSELEKKFKRIQ